MFAWEASEHPWVHMAGDRARGKCFAGDIIGLHNHGTIQIGDTFTQGEQLKFSYSLMFPSYSDALWLKDPQAKAVA